MYVCILFKCDMWMGVCSIKFVLCGLVFVYFCIIYFLLSAFICNYFFLSIFPIRKKDSIYDRRKRKIVHDVRYELSTIKLSNI